MQPIRIRPQLRLPLIGTLSSLVLLGSFSFLFIRADLISTRPWQGYYTLKVGALSRELVGHLQTIPGVKRVVSQYSAPITFNTFGGLQSVELAGLDGRLEAIDPRLDPYLRQLGKFFQGENSGEFLYLQSEINRLVMFIRLKRLPLSQQLGWRLLEFDPLAKILQLILFFAFLLAARRLIRREASNPLEGLSLLPWLIKLLSGDYLHLFSFFMIYPLWLLFFHQVLDRLRGRASLGIPALGKNPAGETPRRGSFSLRPLVRGFPFFWLLLLANFLLILNFQKQGVALIGTPLISNLLAVASNLLLIPLSHLLYLYRQGRRLHPLFVPLPILRELKSLGPRLRVFWPSFSRPPGGQKLWERRVFIAALLAVIPLVSLPLLWLEKRLNGLENPQPVYRGRGFTWSELGRLFAEDHKALPDLSDYVAHRAYQEGLAFGRGYRFPSPGERIYISSYSGSDQPGQIVKTLKTVKRYQASWLGELLASTPPGSVARLLVDQGSPARVIVSAEAQRLRAHLPGWRLVLVSVFLFSSLVLWDIRLTALLLYVSKMIAIRRNRQAV